MSGPQAFARAPARACLVLLSACLLAAACGAQPQPSATQSGVPTAPAATAPAASATPAPQSTGLGPSGSSPTGPTPSPGGNSEPSPTAGPRSTPDPGLLKGISWARVPSTVGDFLPGDTISDAVALDSLLIAVGTSAADGAAVWTWRDGIAWRRSQDVPDAADSTIDDVTLGPAGVVAVGSVTTDDGLLPAVWTSADGLTWESVHDPDLAAGEMAAVAAGPDGYVALGTDIATSDANVVWTSADGRDWSGPQMAEAFGAQPSVSDVVRLAETYLAFGAHDEQAALWISEEGVEWETAPDFPIVPTGVITAAAHSTTRTVAVGADYGADEPLAFAWSSTDGVNWLPAIVEPAPATGEMLAVLPVGDGFICVGEEGGGDRGGLAAVWASVDGLTWQRHPNDPSFALARMSVILGAGTRLVVLGEAATDASGEDFGPQVWVGVAS